MIKIVLADDHKIVREGVRRLLEDNCGFAVLGEAPDGLQALNMVAELKPDVLVTDLRLPDIGGIEIARKITESLPATKVVIMSMYNDNARVYDALAAGARGYVIKSALDKLPEAISKITGGDIYLSPPLSLEKIERYRTTNNKPPLPAQERFPE